MTADGLHDDPRSVRLMARIASGEADAMEFDAFQSAASNDPNLHVELLGYLADACALRRQSALLETMAQQIALPLEDRRRLARFTPGATILAVTGWAAAALLAVIIGMGSFLGGPPADDPTLAQSVDDAYLRFIELGLQSGRIVEPLEPVMIESRLADGGGVELTVMRGVIERTRVDQVYQYAKDELGRVVRVPADPARFVTPVRY